MIYLPWIVVCGGSTVLIGWVFGIEWLTHIFPNAVSMKIGTAIGFVLSGIAYGLMAIRRHGRIVDSIASTAIVGLTVIMATMVFAVLTGAPNPYQHAEPNAQMSTHPGRPSVCTMTAFLLVAAGGMSWMLELYRITELVGRLVVLQGAIAVLGYAVNAPLLYCYVEDGSTAMAIHTAGLFVLLGLSVSWRVGPARASI